MLLARHEASCRHLGRAVTIRGIVLLALALALPAAAAAASREAGRRAGCGAPSLEEHAASVRHQVRQRGGTPSLAAEGRTWRSHESARLGPASAATASDTGPKGTTRPRHRRRAQARGMRHRGRGFASTAHGRAGTGRGQARLRLRRRQSQAMLAARSGGFVGARFGWARQDALPPGGLRLTRRRARGRSPPARRTRRRGGPGRRRGRRRSRARPRHGDPARRLCRGLNGCAARHLDRPEFRRARDGAARRGPGPACLSGPAPFASHPTACASRPAPVAPSGSRGRACPDAAAPAIEPFAPPEISPFARTYAAYHREETS